MSLSANDRRSVWQEHQESLSRIKTQLSDKRSPVPRGSPVGKSGRQSGHSPYGKYRTTTPPHLPRLETPPDERRKPLRGNRYEVVPPVRNNRQSNSRGTDYDSWGEESDDESEADQGDYMPQPYPAPYPYGAPPPVVFGAPFPVYYPPPPPQQRRSRKNNQKHSENYQNAHTYPSRNHPSPRHNRQPLAERYEDVNRSGPTQPGRKKQNRVKFKDPPPVSNGFYSYPMYPYPSFYEDPYRSNKRDSKYKYIHPRDTPFSPTQTHEHTAGNRYMDDPEKIMLYYMKDHPLFEESLVEGLINQFMDDLIPDLLIDVFHEEKIMLYYMKDHPLFEESLVESLINQFMDDLIPDLLIDVFHEEKIMLYYMKDHPLFEESLVEGLINQFMDDLIPDLLTDVFLEEKIMLYYMKDHPLFEESLVEGLINQFMDDLIPDLLIDVFHEVSKGKAFGDNPLENLRDDIINEELPNILNGIVRSTLTEMVDEYMLYQETEKDPLESFLTRLLNDAVSEATTDVVKETVKEMARTYVQTQHDNMVLEDLLGDYIREIGPALVEDSVFEIYAEEFIEEEVIKPELEEEIMEMSKEVLTHFDTKVMRRELKEVSSQAGDKLIESIMLDYIFSLLARQGKVWTESDHANKYMDDMVTNILLEKLFGVITDRRKTLANKPLRKLHEKVVTDVSVDVMLQQLMASLDEDLLDVDEYERGISDQPIEHRATPQAKRSTYSYS